MQDSDHPASRPGLRKSFVIAFGRVSTRLLKDLRGMIPSGKSDANFLLSIVLIGATVYYIPWVFTVIGVVAISNSLLVDSDSREGKTASYVVVEEDRGNAATDPDPVGI